MRQRPHPTRTRLARWNVLPSSVSLPRRSAGHTRGRSTGFNGGLIAGVCAGLLLGVGASCGPREVPATPPGPGAASGDDAARDARDVVVRERIAAAFAKEDMKAAQAALTPLVERPTPAVRDLVWMAQVKMRMTDYEAAEALARKAIELAPKDPAAQYTFGRVRYGQGYPEEVFEDARKAYEATLAAAPGDLAAKLELGRVILDIEGEAGAERARALNDEVLAIGLENATNWYVTAAYRRYRIAFDYGDEEEARTYQALWTSLETSGFEALKDHELDQGTAARVTPPPSLGTFPATPPTLPTYGAPATFLPELGAASGAARALEVRDVNGDRRPDVIGVDARGVFLALQAKGAWSLMRVYDGDVAAARALDLNQERGGDTLDLAILLRDGALVVLEQGDEVGAAVAFTPSPVPAPALGFAGADLAVADFDHDGDLDLFAVGEGGARLWRNDGAGVRRDEKTSEELPRGVWADATEGAGMPTSPLTWCAIDDFDADQDIDLMCGGPDATHILSSLRRGRFEDVAQRALGGATLRGVPAFADLDGDGRMDIAEAGAPGRLWRQGADQRFTASSLGVDIPLDAALSIADLDLDGAADLAFEVSGRFGRAVLAAGLAARVTVDLPELSGAAGPLVVAELDAPDPAGVLGHELLRAGASGLARVSPTGNIGHGVYVKFFGRKDNRQAVGAVLEARAKQLYRRVLLTGEPELVGLDELSALDVMRVTWPNGVVQHRLDVQQGVDIAAPESKEWVQAEGLVGSCPFLYTWNGATFTFISDVLGITPLGLPIGPDMLVPPDHDEYVLVRGEQLVPDPNGEYVMQFTEELREVTYLDRARLDVVDHPASSEVFPDERFTFPPFPAAHLHTLEGALAPITARGSDGVDWTAALAAEDDVHAVNFTRLGGQFLGLAAPHWLELGFDAAAVKDAPKLRLLFTGWFYWTDASVNMATARTPGVDFVPPIIEVPDGQGGWRPIGPPVGFPAGKTKSMLIDMTEHLVREDPRVRVSSTLELYWDRIALAVCGDDAPRRITSLEPQAAKLWSRGFSKPVPPTRADLPERFTWGEVEAEPRWNQHPGMYTRYGDVLPLVTEVEDRFVIMGSGDSLELRFDAKGLPPLPEGWRRDFLVYLDGWAKDRDPNTVEALHVEPLPFHGMSGYPYGPDEAFPDTELHRAWRAEWNTRPAFQWIPPLAPSRLSEWRSAQRH
ncbi:MAG: FG-GAP-like repeat-containing protein [Planctomycetota bacterium]